MQRLVEQFYPRTVRDQLVSMVAAECGIQRYQVLADPDARAREKRLRRQTLLGAALLRRRASEVQEGLRAAWQELFDPAKAG